MIPIYILKPVDLGLVTYKDGLTYKVLSYVDYKSVM
jgi:hypothetical protein